jgi:hypothetical protein
MALFGDLFGSGYQDAAQAQIAGLQQGYKQASDLYGQGRTTLGQYGAAAIAPYTTIFGTSQPGVSAYGQAVGLGAPGTTAGTLPGTAGNPATQPGGVLDWLSSQPGYQFALGQGLNAIDRGAASRGLLTSGNTIEGEQRYGTGQAQQYYQNYVNNLLPYLSMQNVGAQGLAQGNQWLGGGLASSLGNQGNLAFNTQAGIGQAQGAADIAAQNASNSFINQLVNTAGTVGGAILAPGSGTTSLASKLLGYSSGGGAAPAGGQAYNYAPPTAAANWSYPTAPVAYGGYSPYKVG